MKSINFGKLGNKIRRKGRAPSISVKSGQEIPFLRYFRPAFLTICIIIFAIAIFLTLFVTDLFYKSPTEVTHNQLKVIAESESIQSSITFAEKRKVSDFAYISLISGIDRSLKYRGFFYNSILMKKSLAEFGSTADFIVMLGFDEKDVSFFKDDAELLQSFGIQIFILPRFVDDIHGLSFAEMALLKITPWSLTHYQKVQFLDGDIFPTSNMDCFFQLQQNTFTVGAASPLNSGWFLAIPNKEHFIDLRRLALWRLGIDWNKESGWSEPLPRLSEHHDPLFYRGGVKPCLLWDFNGADMDQGLLTHYFVLKHGGVVLVDTDTRRVRVFKDGLLSLKDSELSGTMDNLFSSCGGRSPVEHFLHFTGQSKPWVQQRKRLASKNKNVDMWMKKLVELGLNVSDCASSSSCGSPLGYWNVNFPKGGFKTLKESAISDPRCWK